MTEKKGILTDRQREMLQASVNDPDASYKTLRARHFCSEETIRKEFKTIFGILGVHKLRSAYIRGLQLGLVELPPLPPSEACSLG